jgi:hypothetical protein
MCGSLAEVREALGRLAADFDPARLSGAEAARLVEECTAIERMAGAVLGLAAARVAACRGWRGSGDRSAAHQLARARGTSVGQAADTLDTARRLADLPGLASAARRGELSAPQASAIADAASADPSAESALLERAASTSLGELRQECARVKAAADVDLEGRMARIHRDRYLRSYTDAEGGWNLRVRNVPGAGAKVMAALAPLTDRLFRAARAEGRREPLEAYAADALTELAMGAVAVGADAAECDRAAPDGHDESEGGDRPDPPERPASPGRPARGGGTGTKIIVRVDLGSLLRGFPVGGEVCELVGFGPVAVSALRAMIDSGDPFLAAVVTRGEAVMGAAHLGRRPNAVQQTALEWLYPVCAAEGCAAQAFLQTDHRVDWARSHVTLLDLLDRLCSHHHQLKTREGWSLVEGSGKRAFVPPDDPRHPGHQRPPPTPPAGPDPGGTATSPDRPGPTTRARTAA